ncbi:MAG: ABC transporter permease [Brasilonema octagenarum HA4186-MV1]|uniref:ABC transporter permease n=1 Tax=Brasilonema sennae CENA114 TaxID=415709 RepID=A0A856MLG3_9CYAN|nr:ABC transporter permease [Brasilonema sennae]MBW4626650.1 ABC transporter permease [Brasilonema octagenarum HA4186-MV1]QDL09766.1 ABC transporter permease [Brasilonema sennae CENA114]QDL16120.1 ABC transporter permease [Brasilonema octagenarum UFV-E1]
MSLTPFDLLALTSRSLSGNPLRSTLTTLGVFMGVAAVTATLQVGSISRAVIARQMAERDAPQVVVYPESRFLRLEDMKFLQKRLLGLQAISASSSPTSSQTVFQDQEAKNSLMLGVSQNFLLTSAKQLVKGRFFTRADSASYRPVVVIDQFLADKLFKGQKPTGKRIYANRRPYIVVGVVKTNSGNNEAPEGQLLVPISVYNALMGSRDIGTIWMRPRKLEDLKNLEDQAKKLLEQRFPSQKFYVANNVEDILEQQKTLESVSMALAAVGVISLLVGGVGIANITIATVAERTSEIGLKLAIGATKQDIMLQFILEAAVLSLLGGTVALITVHGLTLVVADTFDLPYQFESSTAALSLGSALLVGVGAGFLPALRASQLNPVTALRST